MASVQCYRSCQESCQQHKSQQQGSSLGQKVTEMFKGHNNHNHHTGTCTQQCYSKTQVISQSSGQYGAAKTESCGCRTHHHGTAKCSDGRRSRREHGSSRGALFQKIKDGLSGHSSDSGSSSESDSDNEGCRTRKNCN